MAMPRGQATAHDHAAAPPAQVAPVDPQAKQRTGMRMRPMAMDDQVSALTDQMNTATGQERIDAMARLLTALVEQRSMMMREMDMMQDAAAARQDAMQRMGQMMGPPPAEIKK